MKRAWMVAAAAAVAVASSALATEIRIGANNTDYRGGNGGEFTVIVQSGNAGVIGTSSDRPSVANSFQSFCLEVNENLSFGATYAAQINTVVIDGQPGNSGLAGRQTLAAGTAWLYERFRTGALAADGYDYNPGSGRQASAMALQDAIWMFQNQITYNANNSFVIAANNALGAGSFAGLDGAFADADFSQTRVRALNLGSGTGEDPWGNQDLLTLIPLPTGGGLAAAGLLGLAAVRRRRA